MDKCEVVLRSTLLAEFPVVYGKDACCTVGIQCDNPDHPVEYYGNSILQRNYCPGCSYVVSLIDRPDLGSPLVC